MSVAQPHEQHDAHIALPLLRDRDRFGHFGDLLDLTIDLGGADAHAARIEHGVGAPVHDEPAARRDRREIAVPPDVCDSARNRCRMEALSRRCRPRSRSGSTETGAVQTSSPCSIDQRLTGVVEDLRLHAQAEALNLAFVHRQDRTAAAEARHDVGAAGDRREHARRPSRRDTRSDSSRDAVASRSKRSCAVMPRSNSSRGRMPACSHAVRKRGTGAEDRQPLFLGHAPQDTRVGVQRGAIEQDDRCADRQPLTSPFHMTQPQVVK